MMKQLVGQEASNMECVKVVLVTLVAGKPPLLAIDSGRRLVQLNIKPSFAQLERWINELEGRDNEPETGSRRGGGRAKAA
jgi:chemotaxis protein MotA